MARNQMKILMVMMTTTRFNDNYDDNWRNIQNTSLPQSVMVLMTMMMLMMMVMRTMIVIMMTIIPRYHSQSPKLQLQSVIKG